MWNLAANGGLKQGEKRIERFCVFSLASDQWPAYPFARPDRNSGALAQLVEHLHGMQRVSGSNPLRSTNSHFRGGLARDHLLRTTTGDAPVFLSN